MFTLKAFVMVGGIAFSAMLGFWTMNEANLVGQCVEDVCTGGAGMPKYLFNLLQNGFIVGTATATTIGGVLQIAVPNVTIPPMSATRVEITK